MKSTILNRSSEQDKPLPKSVSAIVRSTLFFIGLLAELFAISILPVFKTIPRLELIPLIICVVCMLVHQFINIISFHDIDNIASHPEKNKTLGDWVTGNKLEPWIRGLIFCLLAFVTGEIPYLIYVGSELSASVMNVKLIDITGHATSFYIASALALTVFMFLWSVMGLRGYITKQSADEIKKGLEIKWKSNPDLAITSYPFDSNPYLMRVISDLFSVAFWIGLNFFVSGRTGIYSYIVAFCSTYVIIITLRCVGEYIHRKQRKASFRRGNIIDNQPALFPKELLPSKTAQYSEKKSTGMSIINRVFTTIILFTAICIIGYYSWLAFNASKKVLLASANDADKKERMKNAADFLEKGNIAFSISYLKAEDYRKAFSYYKRAKEIYPDSVFARAGRDSFYLRAQQIGIPGNEVYETLMAYAHQLDTLKVAIPESLKK